MNCPLCGRSQALSRFNPEILDNDVYLVSFRGLGRGKGFIKSGEHSILHPGDPTVELIKNRMLEIIGFFIEKNCVTLNEILNVIQLPDPRLLLNDKEVLEATIGNIVDVFRKRFDDYRYDTDAEENPSEALTEILKVVRSELNSLKDRGDKLEKVHDEIRKLVAEIEKALEDEYDFDSEIELMESLKQCIRILLEEYESFVAIYAEIQGLATEIEEALGEEYDFDPDEDIMESLKTITHVLIEEYEASIASSDEEQSSDVIDEK